MVRSLPKAPWALQTLLLIFAWCSHHSSSSPFFYLPSHSTSALVMFLQRVCLRRAWVIHHGTWVNGFWLPFWGHHDPWGTRPLLRMTQSLKCIWQNIKREGYKKCDSRNTEREPDRHRQWVYHLESTWSKCTAVLNISALVWFEGHICLLFSYSNFPKLRNAMTMIWGKLERHLTFSKLYIPQSEKSRGTRKQKQTKYGRFVSLPWRTN